MVRNYLIVCGIVAFLFIIYLIVLIKKNIQKKHKLRKCKDLATKKMDEESVIISRDEVIRIICYEFKVYNIEEVIPDHPKVLEFIGNIMVPVMFADKIKKGFFPKLADFYDNATMQLVCEIGSLSLVEHTIKTSNEPLKVINYLTLKTRGIKYSDLVFLGERMELDLIEQLVDSINLDSKNEVERNGINWIYTKAIAILYKQPMPYEGVYDYINKLTNLRMRIFDLLVTTERFYKDTLPVWPEATESELAKIINIASSDEITAVIYPRFEKAFDKIDNKVWESFLLMIEEKRPHLTLDQNHFFSKLISKKKHILVNPGGYN
jgi:hypothetical protein